MPTFEASLRACYINSRMFQAYLSKFHFISLHFCEHSKVGIIMWVTPFITGNHFCDPDIKSIT